jgi:diguanylate cyclase (GGDEF)-like protein
MLELEQSSHILIIEDPGYRKTINLDRASYSIGRHSDNDIVLSSQKTSRYHATFVRRTDIKTNKFSYWILDGDLQGTRSRNGIFVNGKKCLVHELKHGDIIKFSNDVKARYHIVSSFSEISEPGAENSGVDYKSTFSHHSYKNTLINKETVIAPYAQFEQLNDSELVRLSSLGELSSQPIIEIDLNGNITYLNSAAIITFKDITRKKQEHPLLVGLTENCSNNGNSFIREVTVEKNIFQQNAHYLPENKIIRSYLTNITQQKKLEKFIQNKGTLYQILLQKITNSVILVDGESKKIVFINPACSNLLGYSATTAVNMTIDDLSFDPKKLQSVLEQVTSINNSYVENCFLRHQEGFAIELNLDISFVDLEVEKLFCIILQPAETNEILNQDHKSLKLSEKKVYERQLETALANAKRNKTLLAVIYLNITNFTEIESKFSNNFNFLLISSFTDRLRTCLRSGDTVSYWGENKFALLMPQIGGVEEVAKISQRIINSLENSFKIEDRTLRLECNLGIAIYPQDGETSDVLLKNANQALNLTQQKRNYNYLFYNADINSQTSVILKLEKFLYQALEKQELLLHYQPQINVNNNKIQGIEVLLRWQHPELGLLLPNSFLKLAEKNGLILPIGEWVLRTACNQNKIWQDQGFPPIKMSINISLIEFKQPNFTWLIKTILEETNLEANLLELEVTTNTLMQDDEYSYQTLSELRDLGVSISVDDFTAGLSSLQKLKKFPLNTLKIDQNFVKNLKNESQDIAVIATMVALGKGLNLRVIAEGVETLEQMKLLQNQECEIMQGFWFSRPLAASEVIKLLPFDYAE